MYRKRTFIVLSILIILLSSSNSGCGSRKENADINDSQTLSANLNENSYTMIDSGTVVVDDYKNINYNNVNKIWVLEGWTGGAYSGPSFCFSKIQKGEVEGRYSTESIAKPEFFIYSFESSKYLGHFTGSVSNGSVEAKLTDDLGNKGDLIFTFKGNDVMEGTIVYTEGVESSESSEGNDTFIFRPFNLKHIQNFEKIKEHSFSIDMDNWVDVTLVSGEIRTEKIVHPVVYFVNGSDDILYVFDAPFKTGTRITDSSIEDVNNDGLKDVIVITSFIEDYEIKPIRWVFLQKENGTFYDSSLSKE